MKGKKVVEFLLLRPAFSSRNLTSLLLVAIFFGVYVLAGGKLEVPDVKQGANFGSVVRGSAQKEGARQAQVAPRATPQEQELDRHEGTASRLSELEERLKNLKRKNGSE